MSQILGSGGGGALVPANFATSPNPGVSLNPVAGTAVTAKRSDEILALDQTAAYVFSGLGATVVNVASSFSGNLLDLRENGNSLFRVTDNGSGLPTIVIARSAVLPSQTISLSNAAGSFTIKNSAAFAAIAYTDSSNNQLMAFDSSGDGLNIVSGLSYGISSSATNANSADTWWSRGGPAIWVAGKAPAASPIAYTIRGQNSRTGTDSNVGGANLTVQSGQGTGTGAPSDIIFKTPTAVASGSGAQTINTALTLKGGTQRVVAGGPVGFPGYTVATLPAGVLGDNAYVTDALAPTFLAAVVGGGAVKTPVFYDGTNWVGA